METATHDFVPADFRRDQYLWEEAAVEGFRAVERLVRRSNILGNGPRITRTGGVNSACKSMQTGPLIAAGCRVKIMMRHHPQLGSY
jgi:rhamnose utilization protein RhaD (predicted bifunctional aldolase and dehydrogenase)